MWLEYLKIAQAVLRSHKFRSFLTVLSVTLGAFSIVLMTSLAQSGLATLFHQIEDFGGSRVLWFFPKRIDRAEAKSASYSRGFTVEDRDHLFERLPHINERSMFTILDRKDTIADGGATGRSDLVAGDSGFLEAMRMRLAKGRSFTEDENRRHAKVCVVGHKVAQELWDGDAIGHSLGIDGVRCRVIGQLANEDRWGIGFGFDWLEVAVLPLETVADVDAAAKLGATMMFKTDDKQSNEIVKRIANALLSERHHAVDDFQIFDFSRVVEKFHGYFAVMEIIVGLLAGVALLVGGVGVMNMMLVSVSERAREIGIRKAIGASPRDIGAQFLLEAMVLSGTGGILGVLLGVAFSVLSGLLVHHFKPTWITVVSQGAILWALAVSLGVGVLFGFFPARRAARLDAIVAIRR